jgi:putative DNA primase/helicase
MAGNNSAAIRVSEYFALLATVMPIIHAALPELKQDIQPMQIIQPLWDIAIRVTEEADRATVALQKVYEWAVVNQTSFWGRHNVNDVFPRPPHMGWAGKWDQTTWLFIAFTKGSINQILSEFDVQAIIKTWKDREWLDTDKKGAMKQVRITGMQTNCYCIKRSTLEDVLKLDMNEVDDA